MQIAVIGGGISGLVVAKTLSKAGNVVTVFERSRNLGGVWNPDVIYPGAHTQNVGSMYRFTDFAPPSTWETFPTSEQVKHPAYKLHPCEFHTAAYRPPQLTYYPTFVVCAAGIRLRCELCQTQRFAWQHPTEHHSDKYQAYYWTYSMQGLVSDC